VAAPLSAGFSQAQLGAIGIFDGFFDKPSAAAHFDHIAGRERSLRHVSDQATNVPLGLEDRDRGPQVGTWRVEKPGNQGMMLEGVLNDAALYARAAAVNQADFAQSGRMGGANVFI